MKTVVYAFALTGSMLASSPALAQAVQVYTDQSLFVSQRPGITTNTFSFATGGGPVLSQYSQDGVSFTARALHKDNANSYGSNVSFLDAIAPSTSSMDTFTITFAGPVLGLTLGSYRAGQTVTYNVNGMTGSLALSANPATSFIGFDTGRANSVINVVFTFTNELDIIGFNTAVPEPASWSMMILGVGAIGAALRRRQNVTTRVQFA